LPVIDDISYDEGQPLRFKAVVEVWPEFDLPSYTRIKVKKKEHTITDEDVQRALEELRDKSAEYLPAEGRGAGEGDYVVIELQGKDRKTKKLMPVEKAIVLVGHKDNAHALNENLPGQKPQEERTFVHTYQVDDKNKKLAGREIEYRVKVISIKEKRVPELNDEFAKTLGEYDTLTAVKEKIREEIQKAREQTARRETAEEIVQTVVQQASMELPESAVEEETDAVLKNILSSVRQHNLSQEAWAELRSRAREQAQQNLKRHLVLRKIAESEAIKVGEEDVDKEIRLLAKESNIPLAQAQEAVNRESLRRSLLLRRAVDFLVEKAIIE
jgi:trigger factor